MRAFLCYRWGITIVDHTLNQIKRLIIRGNYPFTLKAESELEVDGLLIEDALEAIINAESVYKVINSSNPRTGKKEKLYIIKGNTYDNITIYTKGKISQLGGKLRFYILISSKRSL